MVCFRYYVDPPSIVVRGNPSSAMADRLEKDEKARIAAQVKKLGPKGLEAAAKLLEKAKAEHDKPIPNEIIKAFPVPDVKSISWIPVDSVHENGKVVTSSESKLRKHVERDGDRLPFFIGFDHVQVCKLSNSTVINSSEMLTLVRFRHCVCICLDERHSKSLTPVRHSLSCETVDSDRYR